MKLPFISLKRHHSDITKKQQEIDAANLKIQTLEATITKLRLKRKEEISRLLEIESLCSQRGEELNKLQSMPNSFAIDQIHTARDIRPLLATKLSGEGIEIGALHRPLPVLESVTVRYVDLRSREDNIKKFPEVPAAEIVATDFICDGQTLSAVPDASQDFVIANHMLEHCVNPLQTLEHFLRVLKPEGRLFISLPDKRFTFDFRRPTTTWEHVLEDYRQKRDTESRDIYEEYRICVDPSIDPDKAVEERMEIHHHAWTQCEILELFTNARRALDWPLEIELFAKQGCELVLILQMTDPPHEDHAKLT